MYQIQWISQYGVEVVDEIADKQHAKYLCKEYMIAFKEKYCVVGENSSQYMRDE